MRLLNWIKEKYQHRRAEKDDHDPWWVTLMLDVGRPVVAVLILAMCAPGEHFIATESGLSETLAWGMPGTLTAYAGIAAVVATKRPKGTPGHGTAVTGAIVAVLLAMAAQPVAHLWGRFGAPSQTQEVWLTIVAGMVPAAVFGHLLHMGAVGKPKVSKPAVGQPVPETVIKPKTAPLVKGERGQDILDRLSEGVPVSDFLAERAVRPGLGLSEYVSEFTYGQPDRTAPDTPVPDSLSAGHDRVFGQPDTEHVSETDSPGTAGQDTAVDSVPDTEPKVSAVRPSNVRSIKKRTLSGDVRSFLSGHPDADDSQLAAAMAMSWPDAKWDSVRKARDRYQEKQEKTS